MKIKELKPGTFTTYGDEKSAVEHFPLGGSEGGYFISRGATEEEQQAIEKVLDSLRSEFCYLKTKVAD